jgi:endonuclease/exonuclease/phosphatase family metal-dependent hydrolase
MRYVFRFWFAFALGLVLSIGCGNENGEGGSGGSDRQPAQVRIDTFNVALTGALSPYAAERRQPLIDAIAAAESDIICLQEVSTQADKDMIRDGALTSFPYVVSIETDLDTPVDDPTDQNGKVPPAPTTVPCPVDVDGGEGTTVAEQMHAALNCIRDGEDDEGNACSTIPGSDDGQTTSTSCAADACTGAIIGLIYGNPQEQRCYSCVATQLPDETFGTIRERCQTIVNQELPYRGQNSLMILSRYPLKNETVWVLPATWSRRVVLSSTAELPNGAELDVFCNHLGFISDSLTFPYTGPYGDGMTGAAGWEAEQFLQAQKVIAHVQRTSPDRPAIVLGDFNASRADPDHGINPEGEATRDLLEQAFTPAYVEDYVPVCTFCSTNPLTAHASGTDFWFDHVLLHNLPKEVVTATERRFDDNSAVDIGGGESIPLSDHYGMHSEIEVP